MAQAPVSREVLQLTLDTYTACGGSVVETSKRMNIPPSTITSRLRTIHAQGLTPSVEDPNDPSQLKSQIRRLTEELKRSEQERLDHTVIKHKIIQLTRSVSELEPLVWTLKAHKKSDSPGVPTVFLSDLHWAEVVDPKQVNGVNEYNIEIANRRLKHLADRTIRLCEIISPKMDYPGVVVALGGDCYSGNIHDELTATNEMNSMPAVLDLFSALSSFIECMLEKFEYVFVPCVAGNHGRNTRKTWAKDRHHTSFDWLTYCFLAKRFDKNPRVTFFIPDSTDAYYKIYNHRYLLNHGDSFRGGDGMVGPLGPVLRGDHKKRTRNSQIKMDYDTLMIGHFHTEVFTRRVIMNGSLVGFNEFAFRENFSFEPPAQQLWITHPRHGMTYRMPVLVDEICQEAPAREWVSVSK